jgi:hypothetical protein
LVFHPAIAIAAIVVIVPKVIAVIVLSKRSHHSLSQKSNLLGKLFFSLQLMISL